MQFSKIYATIQQPPGHGYTSARSGGVLFDHNSDHRRLRTTRNQWKIKVTKASFPEQKGLKTTQKHRKKRLLSLWDQDAAGSNPVTPMTDAYLLHLQAWKNEKTEISLEFSVFSFKWFGIPDSAGTPDRLTMKLPRFPASR